MTFLEIIATVIGGIAAAIYVASYQCKKRKWILFLGALSRVLFILQYILLGAFSGAALDLIAILAALVAGKKDHPTLKKLLVPIIVVIHAAILVTSILLYQSWYDIFVLLAATFCVAALWFTKERIIRAVSFLSSPCWLVYNLSSKAYFSAVSDSFAILSLLIAIWRYDIRKKKA
jgi:hypothetical protein